MLAAIRQFSKSWVAIVLMLLLLVSLMIWGGASDMFKNSVSSAVVKVGSHEVQGPEFERRFAQALDNIAKQQNGGRPIPREEAVKAHFPEQLLQSLSGQLAMSEAIKRLGIRPGPTLIAQELQKIPQLFDEVTGKFDKVRYRQLLTENKLDVRDFEAGMTDDIALQHLASGFQAGMQPPRIYGALMALNQMENRSWSSFTLDGNKLAAPAAPTDAQLTAFMTELADRIRIPEQRELSIIRFSTKAAEPTAKADPAAVEKLYNFRKDSMSQPELRSLVQIPAKTQADALKAADRLKKGEDPKAIAKSLGVEPLIYDAKPKSAISDRKVADAAFALPAGQVSGAIQGELGFAAVKVTDVKPGVTTTLEQARPALEVQIKHDAAQKAVYAQVEAYEKAHDAGSQMAEAAKAIGVTPVKTGPVNRDGASPDGQPVPGVDTAIIAKAFSMAPNEESEVEDQGGGEYYVVRVDKVTPPTMPTLDSLRDKLTKAWISRETQAAVKKQGDALAARVRKGESLEAVAASVGASVDHTAGVDRAAANQKVQVLGQQLLQGVFSGVKGDVLVTQAPPLSLVITRIDSILPGDIAKMAPAAEIGRQRIGRDLLSDMFEEAQVYARKTLKPKVDTKRAAQALGIQPEDIGAAPAKKGAAAAPATKAPASKAAG